MSDKYTTRKYIEDRVNKKIDEYKEKAKNYGKKHHRVKMLSLIFAAFVPLLTTLEMILGSDTIIMQIIVAVVGATIVVINTLDSKQHNGQKGAYYDSLLKETQKEKFTFLGKTGMYSKLPPDQVDNAFIERCESIFDEVNNTLEK